MGCGWAIVWPHPLAWSDAESADLIVYVRFGMMGRVYRRGVTMNANIAKRNELLAQKVIKGLKSRNMQGYYAKDKEEALSIALELIDEGSSVTMGGGESVHEIGLPDVLKKGNYNFIDRDAYEDKRAAMLAAYDADVFLASANAITEDGVMINIDGNSNRVSAIAQGPK